MFCIIFEEYLALHPLPKSEEKRKNALRIPKSGKIVFGSLYTLSRIWQYQKGGRNPPPPKKKTEIEFHIKGNFGYGSYLRDINATSKIKYEDDFVHLLNTIAREPHIHT